MFFFVNYEGIRQIFEEDKSHRIPDSYALEGLLPTSFGRLECDSLDHTAASVNCGAGTPMRPNSRRQPFLNLFTLCSGPPAELSNPATGRRRYTQLKRPGAEDYVVGRYDWNIATDDSLLRATRGQCDSDRALLWPFPSCPDYDRTRNQFLTIAKKHIFSNS